MAGTIVCCVSDTAEGRGALELGLGLSERLQLRLVLAHVADGVETREAVGDEAALLARIAAEEAADVILVGARSRGRLRRGLDTSLVEQLESETSVPVVIAPRRTRSIARTSASTPARR
jgi:nucleotide-binding universal stress UspA family protein